MHSFRRNIVSLSTEQVQRWSNNAKDLNPPSTQTTTDENYEVPERKRCRRHGIERSDGAEGGNRTRTPLRTRDFKSRASTNSATPARFRDYHVAIGFDKSLLSGDMVNLALRVVMGNLLWIVWLVLGIALIVAEIFTLGFVLFWFGVGAIAAMVMSLFGFGLGWQFVTFAVVSTFLTILSRTIFVSYLPQSGGGIKTGVDALPGQIGTVSSASQGALKEGAVRVYGSVWTAFPIDDEDILTEGEKVEVVEVRGSSIYVRPVRKELPGWR